MVKPSKKKKKFIGKHEEKVSFCLVHRSQKDPLTADEKAPQHVLQVVENKSDLEKRKAEQKKYGVFFDDDYNYLQHLRDVNRVCDLEPIQEFVVNSSSDVKSKSENESKLKLPSSVFASEVEEETGLLNKAAPLKGPQIDWDPDIVAALDDDFDFENPSNQLEDDFIAIANANDRDSQDESDFSEDKENFSEEGDNDNFTSCRSIRNNFEPFNDCYDDIETQSRFTDYSLSSAVIPRNSGLKSLDDRFEKLYEQYDDCEIGSLDGDDIAGHLSTDNLAFQQVLESYHTQLEKNNCKQFHSEDKSVDTLHVLNCDDDIEHYTTVVLEEPTEKWDCESILSTYSNIYNHPKLIIEPSKFMPIHVSKTKGIPLESLKNKSLTKTALKRLDCESENNAASVATSKKPSNLSRKKNETPEEKKLRKCAVKELRRERRVEKKANSLAFKEEKKRQEKVLLNVQQNLQGIKLV